MSTATVRDWMREGVFVCRPDTPVPEAADAMKAHDISALVVVDDDGYAVGVISRTDLGNAAFVQPYLKHWLGLTARHLMSSPVISVDEDTPVDEAFARLCERKVHRLVVTRREGSRERPVGILSLTDLVRHLPAAPHAGGAGAPRG